MENYKKILVLENEIEAELLEEILKERGILHVITTYHDSALDGIYQAQQGWGHVDAAEEDEEEILEIYRGLPADKTILEEVEKEAEESEVEEDELSD